MIVRVPTTQQAVAAALALLTLVSGVLTAADVQISLRLYLTVAFVVLAPGWAVAAYVWTGPPALMWLVAVSLSIALAILVAQIMVSSALWHPGAALVFLAVLTFMMLLHHMVRRPHWETSPPDSSQHPAGQ